MPRALKRHRPLAAEQWPRRCGEQGDHSRTRRARGAHAAHLFSRCFTNADATHRQRAKGKQLRRKSPLLGRGQLSPPPSSAAAPPAPPWTSHSFHHFPPPLLFLVFFPLSSLSFNCLDSPPNLSNQITDSSFLLQRQESVLQHCGWSTHEPPAATLENRTLCSTQLFLPGYSSGLGFESSCSPQEEK